MGAMEEKEYQAGHTVIREGDGGDVLYMVEDGEFDCIKKIDGQDKLLKTYTTGDAFGELALLYNAPRAASIKAKTNGRLFQLDRVTFNHIVKEAAEKKRTLFETTLKKVELLDSIDPYERSQICDVLKEFTFNPGEYVIRQGDIGDSFFIVVSGKLVAERKNG
jgi:cAMP-dependent protein kinase regulator